MKLVMFPYAGGTRTSFDSLLSYMKAEVLVCGYKGRNGENPYKDFKEAVQDCLDQCLEFVEDEDYILFGHSMGAFLACEVAFRMQYIYDQPPQLLLVSGEPSPVPGPCREETESDEELITYLQQMGGTDERILSDRDFLQGILKRMRADFHILNTCQPSVKTIRLRSDLIWMYGKEDEPFDREKVKGWKKITAGAFEEKLFDGGHFYFNDQPEIVAELINGRM